MADLLWVTIAISAGLLVYLAPPFLGPMLPWDLRLRLGHYYYGLSAKALDAHAYVRRVLGGFELLPVGVDDEQKLAQVAIDSGMLSDTKELKFKDPDGRIKRRAKQPVAVVVEDVPAAIDATLAELGYWRRQKIEGDGHYERGEQGRIRSVDPYVPVDSGLRVVDPLDSLYMVSKNVDPETVEVCKELTKERFAEYSSLQGLKDVGIMMTMFLVGVGSVGGLVYLREEVLGGSAGGGVSGPTIPVGWLVNVDMLGALITLL